MNDIKFLLSSQGWISLSKEINKRIEEIEIEILAESDKNTIDTDKLRKLSSNRLALKEVIELPYQLISNTQEVEDI